MVLARQKGILLPPMTAILRSSVDMILFLICVAMVETRCGLGKMVKVIQGATTERSETGAENHSGIHDIPIRNDTVCQTGAAFVEIGPHQFISQRLQVDSRYGILVLHRSVSFPQVKALA